MERVFVITNPMPLHNNSPAVSLGKFVQVICRTGRIPTVIGARIPDSGLPGVSPDVPVRSYPYGGRGIVKLFSFLWLQLRTFFSCLIRFRKNDAVYFWIADKMIGAFLAARLRGAEINYFLYGRVAAGRTAALADRLILWMRDRADYVCAESPSVFDQWNVPDHVRRDCISLFVPEPETERIPWDERSAAVAMMCRLCPGKHASDAIRGFCKVHETMPEYRLKIIGGGVLEDESRRLVHELGADGFITITGWLPAEDAVKELAECRLLLYPTDAEGVPGGILEAMAMGVPALASPAGGIPDIIDNGVDGIILSGTDADTIAAEVTAAISSDGLREMSEAAVNKINDKFSVDAAAANFEAVRASHG